MNNAITVSATNRIFSAAGNYKITVSIVPNYISVRSYKWARGNLYKSGSNFYFELLSQIIMVVRQKEDSSDGILLISV